MGSRDSQGKEQRLDRTPRPRPSLILEREEGLWSFFFFFWLYWVFAAAHGLSLVAASEGCALVVVLRLLVVLASLVAEHRPWGARASVIGAPRPQSAGSLAEVHKLGCSLARGIFLDQAWKPNLLHWHADSLPRTQQGSVPAPAPFFGALQSLWDLRCLTQGLNSRPWQ